MWNREFATDVSDRIPNGGSAASASETKRAKFLMGIRMAVAH